MKRVTPTAVTLASLALVIAGCGSSTSSGGGGGAPAAPRSELKAAKPQNDKYTAVQPPIAVPTLPRKPPRGVKIVITVCSLPVCQTLGRSEQKAAEALGWKVTYLQNGATPQAYETTLKQIVAMKPQVAALEPLVPNSFVEPELKALQAEGTKIVQVAPAGDEPSAAGPVLGTVVGTAQSAASGRLMGDAIAANHGTGAHVVFVWDPSLHGIFDAIRNQLTKVVTATGGSVATLNVSQDNVGKTVPSQIVTYLQAHPDVTYVALCVAAYSPGVTQALKAAGLSDRVKVVSRAPDADNFADVKDGSEFAEVGEESAAAGYRAVDMLVRLVMNVPLTDRNPAGWHQIFIKGNVGNAGPTTTPGFPASYLRAWHLS